jgi:ribosomal protein S27E
MCFGEGCLTTAVERDGKAVYDNLKFNEHSFAWAYNRCECVECDQAYGTYPVPPTYRTCASMCGAHTLMTPTGQKATIYGEEFDKKVTTHEQNGATWNGRDADEVVTTARGAKDLR